jgi:hypothetical protein
MCFAWHDHYDLISKPQEEYGNDSLLDSCEYLQVQTGLKNCRFFVGQVARETEHEGEADDILQVNKCVLILVYSSKTGWLAGARQTLVKLNQANFPAWLTQSRIRYACSSIRVHQVVIAGSELQCAKRVSYQ